MLMPHKCSPPIGKRAQRLEGASYKNYNRANPFRGEVQMKQEYFFSFNFTEEDNKQHFPVTFDVNEDAEEIVIYGAYHPQTIDEEKSKILARECLRVYLSQGDMPVDIDTLPQQILEKALKEFIPIRNLLNFRIFDPLGNFRGSGDNRIFKGVPIKIGKSLSSLGCVTGNIHPGAWELVVGTNAVVDFCKLELKIEINSKEETFDLPELAKPYQPVLNAYKQKKGWVKGDFHSHSNHSDGSLSIEELVQNAIDRKLDFIFLTDHNKISGWETAQNEKFPLLPGIELSTFWGHFTTFGTTKYVDWSKIDPPRGIGEASHLVHNQGGLFCVAHPFTIGDPVCTGCRLIMNVDWNFVDALEIWAGTFNKRRPENTEALKLWRNLLNQGHKIVGIGATDIHSLQDIHPDVPMTCVWVEELTLENILRSVKEGRVYVTRGPEVEFNINAAKIGDTIGVSDAPSILSYSISKNADLKIIYNGEEIESIRNTGCGEVPLHLDKPGYIYLEFWKRGELIALTNPIFIEG